MRANAISCYKSVRLAALLPPFLLLSQLVSTAETPSHASPISEISVPSQMGEVSASMRVTPISGFLGRPSNWTTYVHTAYFPSTGNGWTGVGWGWNADPRNDLLALVDGVVVGLFADMQPDREALCITVSTNRYPVGQTNLSSLIQTEVAGYTNSPNRFHSSPPYSVQLRQLLGFELLLEQRGPIRAVVPTDTRPVRFKAFTVENSNAVVTLEVGTNTLARVAFTKDIVPVWATTNGVSIGPIPTNCVFFSDVISNKLVTRVVY